MIVGAYDLDVGLLYEIGGLEKKDTKVKAILKEIRINSCEIIGYFMTFDGAEERLNIGFNSISPVDYTNMSELELIKIIQIIIRKASFYDDDKIYQQLAARILEHYFMANNFCSSLEGES